MPGRHHEDERQLGVFEDVDPPVGEQRHRDGEDAFPLRDRHLAGDVGAGRAATALVHQPELLVLPGAGLLLASEFYEFFRG
jgi:hypothetical protein